MRSILAGLRTLTLPWGAAPTSPRIVLGPDVPAAFKAAALARGFSVLAVILQYFNATDFAFTAIANYIPSPHPLVMEGVYSATDGLFVRETYTASTGLTSLWFLGDSGNPSIMDVEVDNVLWNFTSTSDLKYNGRSLPRGLVTERSVGTGNFGLETAICTLAGFTFKKGRVYQFEIEAGHTNSVGGTANQFRFRQNYVSAASPGTDVGELFRFVAQAGATGLYAARTIARANTTDLVTDIALTAACPAGIGNVFSSAASPALLHVWDVGYVDDFGQSFKIT